MNRTKIVGQMEAARKMDFVRGQRCAQLVCESWAFKNLSHTSCRAGRML